MGRNCVFTIRSLQAVLEHGGDQRWLAERTIPKNGEWDVLLVHGPTADFILHRSDDASSTRTIVFAQNEHLLAGLAPDV